jgi:hypothetical protein
LHFYPVAAKKVKMDETGIEKFRNDLEFIRLAARQTEKDFERMGYPFSLPEFPVDFRSCYLKLAEELKTICRSADNRLESVLYHIDVPEKVLHPQVACKNAERTAEIILQRELIKVVLKKHYSS